MHTLINPYAEKKNYLINRYTPAKAIDGDITTKFHSNTGDVNPWLNLQLNKVLRVHTVRLFPNFGQATHLLRLKNVEVGIDA